MIRYPESPNSFDLRQYAIDNVVDGIYWIDEQSWILDVNDGACRMVGYSREELTSMTVAQLDPNFPIEKWPAHWDAIRKHGSASFETLHRRKDGSLINVEITANLIIYNGQELNCAFVRDITERKRVEKALIESRAILSGVVNNIPDPIFVKDREGRHQLINDAAEHNIGKPREAVIGYDCMSIFPPDQARKFMDMDAQIIASGQTFTMEEVVVFGGALRAFLTTKGPMRDENGTVIGTFGIARDITARKRDQRLMEIMKFSMDHMGDKVFWVTSDAKVAYANIAACRTLGYSMEEMLSLSVPDFAPDFSAKDWLIRWDGVKKHGTLTFETRHITKSGEIHPVEISVNYLRFEEEEYLCAYARDITQRKQMEDALKLSAMALENSSEGMLVTDESNQIIAVNPAFSNCSGQVISDTSIGCFAANCFS